MVRDWKRNGDSERIKNSLLQNVKAGDIILLHDSGDTLGADLDAPSYTIAALDHVFQEILLQGYICMRVDEMLQYSNSAQQMSH